MEHVKYNEVDGIRRPVSRVLCRPAFTGRGGHSSGPILADRFSRPTRTARADEALPERTPARRPYSVLLQAGLAMPSPSPGPRWALTPPFHPYRPCEHGFGGLLSVALSLGSPPAGVIRRLFTVEPGLSSPILRQERPPGRLILGAGCGRWAPGSSCGGDCRGKRP